MKHQKVLVTGGAGFIGSHLVNSLLNKGYQVRVVDNFSTGKEQNLADKLADIELIAGDLRDDQIVKKVVKGIDFILHQAALGSVPRSVEDPFTTHECNATATLKLLIAARNAGVKRVVYASSSSVYGNAPSLPKVENMPTNPLSPYALSKLTAESYCQLFSNIYGLETVSLRYFNVFGPKQDEASLYAAVIPKFIIALLNKQPITIFGSGKQTRDFTYIDNVVAANLLAMTAQSSAVGEAINVACGYHYSIIELAQMLSLVLSIPLKILYAPAANGDIEHSFADINKAEKLLGYLPTVAFFQGIIKTTNWFQNQYYDQMLKVS